MRNQLYTFFLDYKGGTYVSQVKASSPRRALAAWAETLQEADINGLGSSAKKKLINQINQPPTPLNHIKNTWCYSALLRGDLALIHFTMTKE